jgi:hypothetical protein
MAEVEAATSVPGEKRSAGRPRKVPAEPAAPPRAADSGDPVVHSLIADMYTAQQNGDQAAAQAAADKLAELGFA